MGEQKEDGDRHFLEEAQKAMCVSCNKEMSVSKALEKFCHGIQTLQQQPRQAVNSFLSWTFKTPLDLLRVTWTLPSVREFHQMTVITQNPSTSEHVIGVVLPTIVSIQ